MKKLFIFKIHEDRNYRRDGMVAVVAFSFKEAKRFLLDLTCVAAFNLDEDDGGKFVGLNDVISEFRADSIEDDHIYSYWYLAGSYELKDVTIGSGIKHIAYHDGQF